MGNDVVPFGGSNGIVPYSGGDGGVVPYHGGTSAGQGGGVTQGSAQDAALFESFGRTLTGHGITGIHLDRAMKAAQKWYSHFAAQSDADRESQDQRQLTETHSRLRHEWGADYNANMSLLQGFVNSLPAETRDLVSDARGPDGTALFNHVPIITRLVGLIRTEMYADGGEVPNGGAPRTRDPPAGGTETLAEIQDLIAQRGSKYYRGPQAARLQQRYRELLDQQNGWKDD